MKGEACESLRLWARLGYGVQSFSEPSQSPVRLFGTHCLIRCVIRPTSLNVLGGTSERISAGH